MPRSCREETISSLMAKQAQGNLKVILEICRQFYHCDKKFQVVCSTGIAREVCKDALLWMSKPILSRVGGTAKKKMFTGNTKICSVEFEILARKPVWCCSPLLHQAWGRSTQCWALSWPNCPVITVCSKGQMPVKLWVSSVLHWRRHSLRKAHQLLASLT